MTENDIFTSLLTEVASRLGVEVKMTEDEELIFDFEDGLTASISHMAERRQIFLEAGFMPPETISDQQSADLAGFLLRMNTLLIQEHSMSIAMGQDDRILLISIIPQEITSAFQLADVFEEVVERARWIRSIPDQLTSGKSDLIRNDGLDYFDHNHILG